jgi:hypothetical protein
MAEEKKTNVTENNEVKDQKAPEQPAEKKDDKKEKEKVTWTLGPVSIKLNPTVAKVLKGVGIGGAIFVTGIIGDRIGAGRKGRSDKTVIDSQAAEIDRLNNLIDTAPTPAIPEVVDTVAEVATEAVEEFHA